MVTGGHFPLSFLVCQSSQISLCWPVWSLGILYASYASLRPKPAGKITDPPKWPLTMRQKTTRGLTARGFRADWLPSLIGQEKVETDPRPLVTGDETA
jgi:hypothetical protein